MAKLDWTLHYEESISSSGQEIRLSNGKLIHVHSYQLVIPISVLPCTPNRRSQPAIIPAKIDTGCSYNLAMLNKHLTDPDWANYVLDDFDFADKVEVELSTADGTEHSLPPYDADLWIYGNRQDSARFEINLDGGFVVFPEVRSDEDDYSDVGSPHRENSKKRFRSKLPVIGGRALRSANIYLEIDYKKCSFRLFVPNNR